MPLHVTRRGAAAVILSVQTALDQLHSETDVFDLLACVKRREQVTVRFQDGSTGTIAGLEALVDPPPPAKPRRRSCRPTGASSR